MQKLTRQQAAVLNATLGRSAEEARAAFIAKERQAIIAARRPEEAGLMTSGVVPPGSDIERTLQAARRGRRRKEAVVSGYAEDSRSRGKAGRYDQRS